MPETCFLSLQEFSLDLARNEGASLPPVVARPDSSSPVSFWFVALLLALCLFAASAPSPLYSVYAALWHFSPVTLTAVYAMYSAGALAALLTTGRLSDHVGRRRIVAFALVVQIAGTIAFKIGRASCRRRGYSAT